MAGINEDRDRQVIPLWRASVETGARGELASSRPAVASRFNDGMVDALKREWEESPLLFVATDLVSVALTLGRFDIAKNAAEAIVVDNKATLSARQVAELYLNKGIAPHRNDPQWAENDVSQDISKSIQDVFHRKISVSKRQLSTYPNNPLLWCNLALLYTSLGVQDKAEKAIRSAVSLAPENRFILRSASRFYLHTGQKDRAHRLLMDAANVRSDPWVLSAEIATGAAIGRTSRNIRIARKMLELQRSTLFHLSELASALGTLESQNGKMKSARDLVTKSLVDPAENAIAQAAWLHRTTGVIGTERELTQSNEANAWFLWGSAKWQPALLQAKQWLYEQPFSSRPAMLASHLASVMMEDYGAGITLANQGLLSNPDDFSLQNLLAFSCARNGMVREAVRIYSRVDQANLDTKQRMVWLATWGLIAFRDNNPEIGRQLYSRAIEIGKKIEDVRVEPLARVYYALEELRIGSKQSEEIRKEAIAGAVVLTHPSLTVVVERLKAAKPQLGVTGSTTPLYTRHLKLIY